MADKTTVCVSVRKNAHKMASAPTMAQAAGSTTKRPPFLSSSLPNRGAVTAWAMLAGIRISPVAVPVSSRTCWVYMGMSSSNPKNRNEAADRIITL